MQHDPQQVRAAVDAAARLVDAGDLDGALAAYDAVLDDLGALPRVPADPVLRESRFAARFERASLLAAAGDLAGAAAGFRAAGAGLDPADPDQHHERAMAGLNEGIAHGLAGDPRAAVDAYRGAIADLPDDVDVLDVAAREQAVMLHVNLADAALEAGDPAGAERTAGAVLDLLSDDEGAFAAEQRGLAEEVRDAARHRLTRTG
jgi:tetratricopeptide (TPR) repeat protein